MKIYLTEVVSRRRQMQKTRVPVFISILDKLFPLLLGSNLTTFTTTALDFLFISELMTTFIHSSAKLLSGVAPLNIGDVFVIRALRLCGMQSNIFSYLLFLLREFSDSAVKPSNDLKSQASHLLCFHDCCFSYLHFKSFSSQFAMIDI